MMISHLLRNYGLPLALLGIVTFAIAQPTYVGWWIYSRAPELGHPFWQTDLWALYGPHDAVRWLWLWHGDPAFMAVFRAGLLQAAWITLGVVALAAYGAHVSGPIPHPQEEDQEHRWGEIGDLLASKRIAIEPRAGKARRGIVLGQHKGRIVYHAGDGHVALLGASRTAEKGVSSVLPTIVDWPGTVIVLDPKGEAFPATEAERRRRGPVHLFDPTRPGCRRFNPLAELRGGDLNIGDVRSMSDLMTHGMDRHADPFWRQSATIVLGGLMREACLSQSRPTFGRMVEVFEEGVVKKKPPAIKDRFAQDRFRAFMSLNERARDGVAGQVRLALEFASDPAIENAVSRSEWMVSDLCAGKDPETVYLTFPAAQAASMTMITRMVLQAVFLGMLHDRKMASDGRKKRQRVLLLLEEFPLLGHLPFIEQGMALAAAYGLTLFCVAQDVAQINNVYGTQNAILGNAATWLWAPGPSRETKDEATAQAGTMIAKMRSRSKKVGVFDRAVDVASLSRHPVINMAELTERSRDHFVIFHSGVRPLLLPKARYYALEQYRGRIVPPADFRA